MPVERRGTPFPFPFPQAVTQDACSSLATCSGKRKAEPAWPRLGIGHFRAGALQRALDFESLLSLFPEASLTQKMMEPSTGCHEWVHGSSCPFVLGASCIATRGRHIRVHLDWVSFPFRQECRSVVERGRTVLTCHSPGSAQAVQPANVEFGSLLPPFAPRFESGKGGGKPPQSKAAPFERGMRFSFYGG
jgi:hypothetical protein